MVIGIIGGGASGMAAALAAAENGENQVILMERQARVGRKLQATGNGRCNLTNLHAGNQGYHGDDAAFSSYAIAQFGPEKTLEWFQNKVLTMFNGMPGRKYLYDSMGINLAKGAYPAQWLSGQTKIRFNGGEFPAPVEYDQYLKYLYGDYMQPAPVTQRTSSHTVPWVDLGPYAEDPDGVQAALSGEGADRTHA